MPDPPLTEAGPAACALRKPSGETGLPAVLQDRFATPERARGDVDTVSDFSRHKRTFPQRRAVVPLADLKPWLGGSAPGRT